MSAPTPLRYKGRPVPYIAPWSAERVALPRVQVVSGALALQGQRRAAGVLWKPWLGKLGEGEPDLGDVHGPRQRECMLRMHCRVCGWPVQRDELGFPWLLEKDDRSLPGWPEWEVTTHPPVCEECQPVAAIQCTPNRGRFVSVRVGQVVTDGVYGQLYTLVNRRPFPVGKKSVVSAGESRLRWMLGGQIAATLTGVTVVDMHTQAPESLVLQGHLRQCPAKTLGRQSVTLAAACGFAARQPRSRPVVLAEVSR